MHVENLLDEKILGKARKLLSHYHVTKKKLIKSGKFNMMLISLTENQKIPPHPEPYGVAFIVLEGDGIFTTSEGEFKLTKNGMIFMKANEIRGIKALTKLVIVGVQDGH